MVAVFLWVVDTVKQQVAVTIIKITSVKLNQKNVKYNKLHVLSTVLKDKMWFNESLSDSNQLVVIWVPIIPPSYSQPKYDQPAG